MSPFQPGRRSHRDAPERPDGRAGTGASRRSSRSARTSAARLLVLVTCGNVRLKRAQWVLWVNHTSTPTPRSCSWTGTRPRRRACRPTSSWPRTADCAGSTTPWGTVPACEENFDQCFANVQAGTGPPSAPARPDRLRRGRHARFDFAQVPNEPCGSAGSSRSTRPTTPRMRTPMGRFKHEGATAKAVLGRPGGLLHGRHPLRRRSTSS